MEHLVIEPEREPVLIGVNLSEVTLWERTFQESDRTGMPT